MMDDPSQVMASYGLMYGEDRVCGFTKNKNHHFTAFYNSNIFEEIVGIDEQAALNTTDYDMPWANVADKIQLRDLQAMKGEVVQSNTLFMNPRLQQWRRIVCIKGKFTGQGVWGCIIDVTPMNSLNNMPYVLDFEKECVHIGTACLSKLDMSILSHYLAGMGQRQIGIAVHRSVKTVEKRLNRIKEQLLSQDPKHKSLFSWCNHYRLTHSLLKKPDWFDTAAETHPIENMNCLT